jgi:class 3 adenylate cyclase
LAIGFSDLRGFTSYTAERGDREALRIARDFAGLVEAQIVEHGGKLLKTYGDGVMTTFEDAGAAAQCAAGMQSALSHYNEKREGDAISAGIGLSWGTAIQTDDDVFGHTVNVAKRLADLAKGWQIIVSSAIVEQSGARANLRFRSLGERPIKGLDAVHVYELVWRDEVAKLSLPDDSVDFVLTEDQKLVMEFAKPLGDTLLQIQERLRPKQEEKGVVARFRRNLAARFERDLPKWIDAVGRYAGLGLENRLDEIDASITGGTLRIQLPDGKTLNFSEKQINLEEAQRFLARLTALRGRDPQQPADPS